MASQPYISLVPSNLATFETVRQPIRFEGKDVWIDVDLEVLSPAERDPFMVALAMSDRPAMSLACSVSRAMSKELGCKSEQSVYVIGTSDRNVSKIGLAGSPGSRFKELQGANWADLHIAGLLWAYGSARLIEHRALKTATEMGKRLNGEWVALSPDEATLLVAEAACSFRSTIADSGMWVRNRNRVAEARNAYKKLMAETSGLKGKMHSQNFLRGALVAPRPQF